MNKETLQSLLVKNKITPFAYSLGGGLPNEKYVLDQGVDKWSVYYSERGQKNNEKVFKTEDEACQYMLKQLTSDRTTHVFSLAATLTPSPYTPPSSI